MSVRVAVAGAGYWGINHVRAFASQAGAELAAVIDPDENAVARALKLAPGARPMASFDAMLNDSSIDAVVLATPAVQHAEQAIQALTAGKHVLVEKPLALTLHDAERVARTAESSGRVLMVGHLMVYHPAVEQLRTLISDGTIGEVYYLYASRVNLGRLRRDENALWSFGPHDVSIIQYVLGQTPTRVAARGHSYLQPGIEDVVFMHMDFSDGKMAHVQLSWLDPRKERRLTIVGSRRMVEFDDAHPTEKLRIYDKGYDRPPAFTQFGEYLTVRHGDVHIPRVGGAEPLQVECRHFITSIREGTPPRSGIASGLDVVRVLEAAQRSLEQGGVSVTL